MIAALSSVPPAPAVSPAAPHGGTTGAASSGAATGAASSAPSTTPAQGAAFEALLGRVRSGGAAGSDATSAPPGLAGRAVLDVALLQVGRAAPAGAPGSPRDGSGFVASIYSTMGVTLPATLAEQATMGVAVPSLAAARSGDLIVLGHPARVGIYAGRGRIAHAPGDGGPVRLSPIDGPVTGIRRIVSEPVATTAPATATPAVATASVLRSVTAPADPRPTTGTLAGVPYGPLFEQAAAAHGVDAALLAAVARTESGFNPRAVSSAGAQGLMQFMPRTAAGMGVDPWDPASAIDGAARYLRQGLDRFGSVELALAAYNAGPGAVQRHGGIPPFAETQAYVRKVVEAREQYQR